ncbi:MAG TPA: sigma-70 family RNA polymerase sigma factor [Pyrinomonadaceae bacterium]|nr:sigma-70 family RNA polymerase sigma factor [Pyrinomonadaceae bacterium]
MNRNEGETLFEAEALPHLDVLYRSAVRLTADRAEAEDLVQDVYALAWASFAAYEPGTNCRAWLFKILMNKLEHQRRRKFALMKRTADATGEPLAERVAYVPPVEQELKDEEVLAALERVPPRFREVVLLADVEEFSYREIAEITGVPVGTVMSRLSRGRKLLREMLAHVAAGYRIGAAAARGRSERTSAAA